MYVNMCVSEQQWNKKNNREQERKSDEESAQSTERKKATYKLQVVVEFHLRGTKAHTKANSEITYSSNQFNKEREKTLSQPACMCTI